MDSAPPEMEKRYRRFLEGWGDVVDPLSLLLGDRDERADTRAWAALILSRIYLCRGRLCLASSFHRISFGLFREGPRCEFPLRFWMNRALILRAAGKVGASERLLRRVFTLSLGKGRIFAATSAAILLADILARMERLDESASFLAVAERSCEALGRRHERTAIELVGALLASRLGMIDEAIERVSRLVIERRRRLHSRELLYAKLLLAEFFVLSDDCRKADAVLERFDRERSTLTTFRPLHIRYWYLRHRILLAKGNRFEAGRALERAEMLRTRLGLGLFDFVIPRRPSGPRHGTFRAPHEAPGAGDTRTAVLREDCSGPLPCRYAASGGYREGIRMNRLPPVWDANESGERLVTDDPRLLSLLDEIREASALPFPVLIRGESGVGKEVVSRLVHRWSGRGGEPFVPVNAAALPEKLFESLIFGHVRGAFTGAVSKHSGLLGEAGNGTILFDEIGDLGSASQAKLLRFLDSGEYRPLGAVTATRSGVRVIAATNRDLEEDVESGRFRRDLYHRLSVLRFRVPPLRERRCDIPLLIRFFFDTIMKRYSLGPFTVGEGAMRLFLEYEWPGNVRELQGEIIRAAVRKRRGTLRVFDFSENLLDGLHRVEDPGGTGLVDRVCRLERDEIVRALAETGGNHTRAAALLGLKRTTLIYKMKRLGIE